MPGRNPQGFGPGSGGAPLVPPSGAGTAWWATCAIGPTTQTGYGGGAYGAVPYSDAAGLTGTYVGATAIVAMAAIASIQPAGTLAGYAGAVYGAVPYSNAGGTEGSYVTATPLVAMAATATVASATGMTATATMAEGTLVAINSTTVVTATAAVKEAVTATIGSISSLTAIPVVAIVVTAAVGSSTSLTATVLVAASATATSSSVSSLTATPTMADAPLVAINAVSGLTGSPLVAMAVSTAIGSTTSLASTPTKTSGGTVWQGTSAILSVTSLTATLTDTPLAGTAIGEGAGFITRHVPRPRIPAVVIEEPSRRSVAGKSAISSSTLLTATAQVTHVSTTWSLTATRIVATASVTRQGTARIRSISSVPRIRARRGRTAMADVFSSTVLLAGGDATQPEPLAAYSRTTSHSTLTAEAAKAHRWTLEERNAHAVLYSLDPALVAAAYRKGNREEGRILEPVNRR